MAVSPPLHNWRDAKAKLLSAGLTAKVIGRGLFISDSGLAGSIALSQDKKRRAMTQWKRAIDASICAYWNGTSRCRPVMPTSSGELRRECKKFIRLLSYVRDVKNTARVLPMVEEWIERLPRSPIPGTTYDATKLLEAVRDVLLSLPDNSAHPKPTITAANASETAAIEQLAAVAAWCDAAGARAEGRHSVDFRSVNWFGTQFTFTANQAACVKLLWQAWEHGTPDVGGQTVLEAAESAQDRLDLLFRGHPAWGTMIVPGGTKGSYRLKPPKSE